jgi:hypothetical protein
MKVLVCVLLGGAAILGIVLVLTSTLSEAKYEHTPTNLRGALAVNAISQADQATPVWSQPRPTTTRKERIEMRVGDLKVGEKFTVISHFQKGSPIWIRVRSLDRDMEGWIVTKPHAPVYASLVEEVTE